jgi:putative Mn2+ efflux pump MntP
MDYLTLILLSLGLSLGDFGLAFALSLLMPSGTFKKLMVNAGKMAVAFSISTALLPLLGWLVARALLTEYLNNTRVAYKKWHLGSFFKKPGEISAMSFKSDLFIKGVGY